MFTYCRQMPKWEIPLHILIVIIGIVGGVSATYAAVKGITDPAAFVPPCYVNITAASSGGSQGGHWNARRKYQSVLSSIATQTCVRLFTFVNSKPSRWLLSPRKEKVENRANQKLLRCYFRKMKHINLLLFAWLLCITVLSRCWRKVTFDEKYV